MPIISLMEKQMRKRCQYMTRILLLSSIVQPAKRHWYQHAQLAMVSRMFQLKYACSFIVSKLDVFLQLFSHCGDMVTKDGESYSSLNYGTSLIMVFMDEPLIDSVYDYEIKMGFIKKFSLGRCINLYNKYKESGSMSPSMAPASSTLTMNWIKEFEVIIFTAKLNKGIVSISSKTARSLEVCMEDKYMLQTQLRAVISESCVVGGYSETRPVSVSCSHTETQSHGR